MNEHKLKKLFPNASKAFLQNNSDSRQPTKLEQDNKNEPLESHKAKKGDSRSGFIIVIDVRKRLLDDDNLCEKFHIDALRYSGVISNDSTKQYRIFTTQRKCLKNESPHTLFEIYN